MKIFGSYLISVAILSTLICGLQASFLDSLMPGALQGPACVGQTSLSQGSCRAAADCKAAAGFVDGNGATVCPLPQGSSCCVPSVKCGKTALLNNTAFSNDGYPNSTTQNSQCSITINIPHPSIKLVRLDFDDFIIAQPDGKGECAQDKLVIEGAAEQQGVLPLCGDLTGQHLYIQVADGRQNIVIQIITSGTAERTWFIRAAFIEETNPTFPPVGCRQYYWGKLEGKLVSLNFNANRTTKGSIDGVKYAACFRSEAGYCRLQFEAELFKLAPHQRTERAAEAGNIHYGQPQPAMQQWQPMHQGQPGYQPQPGHGVNPAQPAHSGYPAYQQPIQPAYHQLIQPAVTDCPPSASPIAASTMSPNESSTASSGPVMPLPAGGATVPPLPANVTETASDSCAGRDRVGLPPSNQADRSIFCNDDFNGGKPYACNEAPFNVYYDSSKGNRHGLGYVLKYTHLVC